MNSLTTSAIEKGESDNLSHQEQCLEKLLNLSSYLEPYRELFDENVCDAVHDTIASIAEHLAAIKPNDRTETKKSYESSLSTNHSSKSTGNGRNTGNTLVKLSSQITSLHTNDVGRDSRLNFDNQSIIKDEVDRLSRIVNNLQSEKDKIASTLQSRSMEYSKELQSKHRQLTKLKSAHEEEKKALLEANRKIEVLTNECYLLRQDNARHVKRVEEIEKLGTGKLCPNCSSIGGSPAIHRKPIEKQMRSLTQELVSLRSVNENLRQQLNQEKVSNARTNTKLQTTIQDLETEVLFLTQLSSEYKLRAHQDDKTRETIQSSNESLVESISQCLEGKGKSEVECRKNEYEAKLLQQRLERAIIDRDNLKASLQASVDEKNSQIQELFSHFTELKQRLRLLFPLNEDQVVTSQPQDRFDDSVNRTDNLVSIDEFVEELLTCNNQLQNLIEKTILPSPRAQVMSTDTPMSPLRPAVTTSTSIGQPPHSTSNVLYSPNSSHLAEVQSYKQTISQLNTQLSELQQEFMNDIQNTSTQIEFMSNKLSELKVKNSCLEEDIKDQISEGKVIENFLTDNLISDGFSDSTASHQSESQSTKSEVSQKEKLYTSQLQDILLNLSSSQAKRNTRISITKSWLDGLVRTFLDSLNKLSDCQTNVAKLEVEVDISHLQILSLRDEVQAVMTSLNENKQVYEMQLSNAIETHRMTLKAHALEIDSLQNKHQNEIQRLMNESRDKITNIQAEHANAIDTIQRNHNKFLIEKQDEHDSTLRGLHSKYQHEIAQLNDSFKEDISSMKKTFAFEKSLREDEFEAEKRSMDEKFKSVKVSIEQDHVKQINQLKEFSRREKESLINDFADEKLFIAAQQQREIKSLENRMKSDFDDEKLAIDAQHRCQIEALEEKTKSEKSSLEKSHQNKIKELQSTYLNEKEAFLVEYKTQKSQLEEEIKKIKANYDQMIKDIETKSSLELSTVKESHELTIHTLNVRHLAELEDRANEWKKLQEKELQSYQSHLDDMRKQFESQATLLTQQLIAKDEEYASFDTYKAEVTLKLKQHEATIQALTKTIESVPASLSIAQAEIHVLEAKLDRQKQASEEALHQKIDEANRFIGELQNFNKILEQEKENCSQQLQEQSATINQLSRRVQALQMSAFSNDALVSARIPLAPWKDSNSSDTVEMKNSSMKKTNFPSFNLVTDSSFDVSKLRSKRL